MMSICQAFFDVHLEDEKSIFMIMVVALVTFKQCKQPPTDITREPNSLPTQLAHCNYIVKFLINYNYWMDCKQIQLTKYTGTARIIT